MTQSANRKAHDSNRDALAAKPRQESAAATEVDSPAKPQSSSPSYNIIIELFIILEMVKATRMKDAGGPPAALPSLAAKPSKRQELLLSSPLSRCDKVFLREKLA